MTKSIIFSLFLITLFVDLSAFAGTPQDWGKWKKGELLIENYSFEEDLAGWELEDGACCDRGGLYTMEIDKKNPQHGNKSLKIVGHKATGTPWHAKVKQISVSMEQGEKYSVVFWARAEKQREVIVNFQTQHDPWTNHLSGQPDPTIILNGPEWEEYDYTFTATADVVKDMWVSLSIAQSDVDFWIDNFRYFEGEPEDDLNRDTPSEPPRLAADVNGDGMVNIQDLVTVAAAFGEMGETPADVNSDGVVNIQDLVSVAAAFGETEMADSAPSTAHLSPETVQQWLSDTKQLNLTDATSQRGIRFLKQLLLILIPKETMLLPNYPNPFNPETWIPYQLASSADVTLRIHAVDGGLVRTLSLGHKAVGTYQSRNRAAYWDGRNEVGEPVASGVYFYTLTTDGFNATRKMLIRK